MWGQIKESIKKNRKGILKVSCILLVYIGLCLLISKVDPVRNFVRIAGYIFLFIWFILFITACCIGSNPKHETFCDVMSSSRFFILLLFPLYLASIISC